MRCPAWVRVTKPRSAEGWRLPRAWPAGAAVARVVGLVSLEASSAEGDDGGCACVVLGSGAEEVGGGAGAGGAEAASGLAVVGGARRAGGSSGRLRGCVLWSCQREMDRQPKNEHAVKALLSAGPA